ASAYEVPVHLSKPASIFISGQDFCCWRFEVKSGLQQPQQTRHKQQKEPVILESVFEILTRSLDLSR
ncbi:hypothetical protein STEG23_008718, partial [Scotinomys teguina]